MPGTWSTSTSSTSPRTWPSGSPAGQGQRDAFAEYRIDEQLAKALERKVWLPSGGSLVIDKTEAMTVVDVNTGKFTGQGGNLEETVTRNNLEAAEEIVRQLRLRDVAASSSSTSSTWCWRATGNWSSGGCWRCLSRDRTKHQVAEVTSLGLVQMTRKRVGAGLLEAFSTPCECCNGRGVILTFDPDSDGPAPAQHTHSRGHGNGGHGNGGHGERRPRAQPGPGRRPRPLREPSAPAEPSASAPTDASPADATGAPLSPRPGFDPGPGLGCQYRPERRPAGQRPGPGRRARARAFQRSPSPPQARRRYRPGHPSQPSRCPDHPRYHPSGPSRSEQHERTDFLAALTGPGASGAPEAPEAPKAPGPESSGAADTPAAQDGAV